MQSVPVDAAEATTSFEAQQPASADVVEATTSFEAQQHVDSTMSFDAAQFDSTITFEKQGTAIAESLPVSDEQGDAADDDGPIDAAEIQDAAEDEPVEANSDEEQYAAAEQDDSTEVEQEEVPAVSELPRQMSRGLTPRRFSPCRPRVVPVPRLPMLLPPRTKRSIPLWPRFPPRHRRVRR